MNKRERGSTKSCAVEVKERRQQERCWLLIGEKDKLEYSYRMIQINIFCLL